MRVFWAHSGRDKPLLWEIQDQLPHCIRHWIDEKEIPPGQDIDVSIAEAIATQTDVFALFITPESVRSRWVRRELELAMDRERQLDHIFVLPIVLDRDSWNELPAEVQSKSFLECTDFSKMGVRQFRERLQKALTDIAFRLLEGRLEDAMIRQSGPLKLRECLATGKPTVSVDVPEVRMAIPHVRIAGSTKEFLRQLDTALAEDSEQAAIRRRNAVRNDGWDCVGPWS